MPYAEVSRNGLSKCEASVPLLRVASIDCDFRHILQGKGAIILSLLGFPYSSTYPVWIDGFQLIGETRCVRYFLIRLQPTLLGRVRREIDMCLDG